ncbi:hypothetical protein OH77DRAFT_1423026 [Trametes cingulata]|nr:hypothetical protein OH77DRAFT_1423026 [Trametes cingulata]
MPLSEDSQQTMLSIFKGRANARHKLDWSAFTKAMTELGFAIERQGVVYRFHAPKTYGGGVLTLHMEHDHTMQKSGQDRVMRRLSRAFHWDAKTFEAL